MKQSFYYNGTILTMEGHTPQYVEAVLVEGGVIQAAGERSVLERDIHGKARMVNLGGKTMLPGFVDAYSGLARTVYEKVGKRSEGKGLSIPTLLRNVTETAQWYASYGITTAQEGNCGEKEWQLLRLAGLLGRLPIDVACYFKEDYADGNLPQHYPMRNAYSFRVRKAGCVLHADCTEYVSQEGKKLQESCLGKRSDREWKEMITSCLDRDWQMSVRVDSEKSVEQFLRCYESVLAQYPENHYLRPVLVNAKTIRKDQMQKAGELGLLVSFCIDQVYYQGDEFSKETLGAERAERVNPLRTALRSGLPVTVHQATPDAEPNMLFSIHNAVNRVSKDGRILGEQERISPYEALRAVTIQAAYQIFEEEHKGSIRAGKEADFVILDQNPLKVAPEEIKGIKVLETIKRDKRVGR